MLNKMLAVVAVSSMVAMPVLAAPVVANPAASLSISKAASAKPTKGGKKSSQLAGPALVLAIAAVAAAGVGVAVAVDGGSDSN